MERTSIPLTQGRLLPRAMVKSKRCEERYDVRSQEGNKSTGPERQSIGKGKRKAGRELGWGRSVHSSSLHKESIRRDGAMAETLLTGQSKGWVSTEGRQGGRSEGPCVEGVSLTCNIFLLSQKPKLIHHGQHLNDISHEERQFL